MSGDIAEDLFQEYVAHVRGYDWEEDDFLVE
jgi:hypothetical protein